ncbi:S8 family peptidase [Paenibacillus chungangensis]|uniref:S8 family peptidase n=1 Tax=Paenibacillus chungangensis TaxID=696535 RepID=A0ABW3HMD4_9BACL
MRKPRWIAAFTMLAVIALLIPVLPGVLPRTEPKAPETAPHSVAKEQKLKLTALQNDMSATSALMAAETRQDLNRLIQANDGIMNGTGVKDLMEHHPHLAYIEWSTHQEDIKQGYIPKDHKRLIAKYVSEAKQKSGNGMEYESPAVESSDGNRYIVISIPGTSDQQYIVTVLNANIVKSVERHQKQNLRIIPYPAEGKFHVESVQPNTTKDITVQSGEDNGNASHYYIRDVIVHFSGPVTPEELNRIKADIHAQSADRIGQIGHAYVFRSDQLETKQLMHYFKTKWNPKYVEPHYLYLTNQEDLGNASAPIVPNDVLYSRHQWNLPSIEAEKGWQLSKGDEGVIIAVLDTGVESSHPDLRGRLVPGVNIVSANAAPEDDVGHGTHVAGIIGASVNNNEGVAGVSWYNKIMPVKVLDGSGAGSAYSVAQGIIWAVDHGAKVINMSLGNYAQADFLHDAVKYAYERDVVLIAASGNDNTERPGYPAAYPEVFAVAATTSTKQKASFSNFGNYIDVAAPGDQIASTYPGKQYAALSGTSMASPHVAALAGLIRSLNPQLTNTEVMEIMRASSIDLGNTGKDKYYGYGEIDVNSALQATTNYSGALQTYPQQVKRRLERIKAHTP